MVGKKEPVFVHLCFRKSCVLRSLRKDLLWLFLVSTQCSLVTDSLSTVDRNVNIVACVLNSADLLIMCFALLLVAIVIQSGVERLSKEKILPLGYFWSYNGLKTDTYSRHR